MQIDAPIEKTFAIAVPIDLPSIMKPTRFLPGIERVEDQSGNWDHEGQTRRIYLTDKSSVFEQLTLYQLNERFSYHVSAFTGPLKHIVSAANGDWRFQSINATKTNIHWTYAFTLKNIAFAPIVWLLVHGLWSSYIQMALDNVKSIVENSEEKR